MEAQKTIESLKLRERIFLSLNTASANIQKARTAEDVFKAVGEELQKFKFITNIILLDQSKKKGRIGYTSVPPRLVAAAEKLIGLSRETFEFNINQISIYERIREDGGTYIHTDLEESLKQMLGRPKLARYAGKVLGITGLKTSITAPLMVQGDVVGLLDVNSRDLTQEDIPAITAFANQISTAVENIDLHQQEREAAADRERAAVVDAMGDGLMLLDMEGKILSINPALEKMGGYEKSEMVGKNLAELVPKMIKSEDVEKIIEALGIGLAGKAPAPLSFTAISKDGREVPYAFTASFIRDAEGKPTFIIATFKDITDLKRAEQEREEAAIAHERAAIIDAMADPLVVLDLNGEIVTVNPAFTKMFGRKPREVIGKGWDEMTFRSEDIKKIAKAIQEAIAIGESKAVETVAYAADGRHIPISVAGAVLKDAEGNLKNVVCTIRDVTQLRKLISDLEASRSQLQDKNEDLEKFAKVAVGRELKMAKLEEEIMALREELKKKKKKG